MATLLQQIEEEERLHDIEACRATRLLLKEALHELVPGQKVVVFGSLAEPARFRRTSDVDIALEVEPASFSAHALGSLLEERLGRPVDVVLLSESRLEDIIRKKGKHGSRRPTHIKNSPGGADATGGNHQYTTKPKPTRVREFGCRSGAPAAQEQAEARQPARAAAEGSGTTVKFTCPGVAVSMLK